MKTNKKGMKDAISIDKVAKLDLSKAEQALGMEKSGKKDKERYLGIPRKGKKDKGEYTLGKKGDIR